MSLWVKERQFNEENKIKSEANLHDTDFEEAMGIYNNLVEKYPDSPMTTRTLLAGWVQLPRARRQLRGTKDVPTICPSET
jgi:hypothetical protein